jgi:hypothetical protein
MARPRNEGLWNELLDLPIFTDKENPKYDEAWRWIDKLMQTKLSGADIICLTALLKCCISYRETE